MKYLLFILLIGLGFTACKHNHSHNSENSETVDKSGPEYTSTFICPMHCEGSGSDEPGKCPVCKMNYVINEDLDNVGTSGHDHDDHDHDEHDHDGHDHDSHNH
jgi:hypothetical protein